MLNLQKRNKVAKITQEKCLTSEACTKTLKNENALPPTVLLLKIYPKEIIITIYRNV